MKVLKTLLCIFKAFGISSCAPHDHSNELFLLGWKVCHLILALSLLVSIFNIGNIMFDNSSPMSYLTDVFQFLMPSIAHHTILIETFYKYKTQRIIWSFPCKLAGHLSKLGVDIRPVIQNAMWRFLIQLIFVQGISVTTELLIIYGIAIGHGEIGWMYLSLFKLIPFSMGRMSLLFHGLFVTYIDTYIKAILTETHHLGTLSKRRQPRMKDSQLTSTLLIVKDTYDDLTVMNQYVNKIFTLSHMTNFVSMFITLAACFYWYCNTIRNGTKHPIETVLCPVGTMIAIIYITMICESSLNNMKKLPHELHRIEITKERSQLRNVVYEFTLQVEHQPIRFCAGTLFEVNAILLKDIFAITCTFMVIFVQFMIIETK